MKRFKRFTSLILSDVGFNNIKECGLAILAGIIVAIAFMLFLTFLSFIISTLFHTPMDENTYIESVAFLMMSVSALEFVKYMKHKWKESRHD